MSTQLDGAGSGSRNSSPARPGANQCIRCSKAIGKKLSLKCGTCNLAAHLLCMPEWSDLTSSAELNHVIKRPGLVWYCPNCHPTLKEYFPAPGVKPALDGIDEKLQHITQLLSENSKITKSFAQVAADQRTAEEEVRAATLRIEERSKKESSDREKCERKQSAVLHNIPKDTNTHDTIFEYLQALGFDCRHVDSISRVGRRTNRGAQDKSRPVKIKFVSEVIKIDFLRYYNKWEEKADSFATLDLTKEEQQREYNLRCRRRDLQAKNESNRYRVRNGELQQHHRGSWVTVDDEGNIPAQTPASSTNSTAVS